MCLLQFLHLARHRSLILHWKFFISELYNTWSSDSSRPCYYYCLVTFVLHLYHSHLSHLTPYLFHIFIATYKMEDQRGIITIDIISLIISMIITEEHGKTIDIIFIDAKPYDGRKDISKYN